VRFEKVEAMAHPLTILLLRKSLKVVAQWPKGILSMI